MQHLKAIDTTNSYSIIIKRSYLAITRELQNVLSIYRHTNAPDMSRSVQKLFFSLSTSLKIGQLHS